MRDDDLPWMRFHIGDYLRWTRRWPFVARALFLELMVEQWIAGSLPAETDQVRALVPGVTDMDWQRAWPLVEPHFPADGDLRRNGELEAERQRTLKIRQQNSRAAKKRWNITPIK